MIPKERGQLVWRWCRILSSLLDGDGFFCEGAALTTVAGIGD